MVLIGDFLAPLDDVKATVESFASRGVHGHLLQILDPAEETLPFSGRIRFEGMEGEENVLIGRAEGVRDEYRGLLAAHRGDWRPWR